MKVVEMRQYVAGKVSDPVIQFRTGKKIDNLFGDLKRVLFERWKGLMAQEIIGDKADEETYLVNTGVSSFSTCKNVLTNRPAPGKQDIHHTGRNSCVMGSIDARNQPGPITFRTGKGDVQTECSYIFTVYPEGYVINTGKTGCNLFGVQHALYLVSIGKKNVKTGNLNGAHIFPSLTAVAQYMERHRDVFRYLVEKYGYEIRVEPACENFAKDMDAVPEKEKKKIPEIDKLIREINASDCLESEETEKLKGVATKKEMKREAIKRLTHLGVMEDVVESFISEGKIYMSEFGGILYDLDQGAKEAVERTEKQFPCLPYAVIKTVHEVGILYAVLYVSKDKTEWKYQRPDKYGLCHAYVYNADEPDYSEGGEICVQGAHGGLFRTA